MKGFFSEAYISTAPESIKSALLVFLEHCIFSEMESGSYCAHMQIVSEALLGQSPCKKVTGYLGQGLMVRGKAKRLCPYMEELGS